MTDLLTAFRDHLVCRRRAPRTVQTYLSITTAFVATTTGARASPRHVENFLGRPRLDGTQRASAGHNQELAALRALSAFAVREKHWRTNPTKDIPFVREAPHDPVVLNAGELHHLFRAAAEKPPSGEGTQLLAILALLSQTALRVHELAALDVDQVDLPGANLLGIHGKGDTIHTLPLNDAVVMLLANWLPVRATRAPPGEKALFISSRQSRLSVRTIENWFVHLRATMGTAKKITPHTLRHSAATNALMAGIDLATVAELLRHSDLNTTRKYLHLVDTRRREAVHRLAVTVPAEVLRSFTPATPANAAVPDPPETPATSPHLPLDDQYGLAAA